MNFYKVYKMIFWRLNKTINRPMKIWSQQKIILKIYKIKINKHNKPMKLYYLLLNVQKRLY